MDLKILKYPCAFSLFIIFIPLILTKCNMGNTGKLNAQEYTIGEIKGSSNVLIETEDFSGVIFQYTPNGSSELHSEGFTPTVEEVIKAEYIFQQCLKVKRIGSDGMEIDSSSIQYPARYLRQYFGYFNEKGDRIIFLNCISKESATSNKWQKEVILTRDGGNNYFSISINMTTQDCSGFMVNGRS